ncbi:sensor histidine kinase [Amycolatopsis rhizosphaerae]|uniref:sensor histidine kinase n=1 Tax=Amycolatopsis rhizosphaerae TaxID=2053003 RepID=UPI001643936D|nr:ATP-binding protein [Amycolatopsis rhizosphaerae]
MPRHLTARARLTILYTGLVLAAGIVLTGLTYLLMRQNLVHRVSVIVVGGTAAGDQLPPVPQPPSEVAARVQAAALSAFLSLEGIALAVVTVLAAVLGWLVAGRVLRPIRTISATAQRLSAENLSERVPVAAPADELTTLADTINGMLDRIQQGVLERDRILHGQRMFTANAAHELRTPLTTMRTAIDVTLDGDPDKVELLAMIGDVASAVEHSQRTLDGLLALARSQAGSGTPRSVDFALFVERVLNGAAEEIAARDLVVRTELDTASTTGEPILLERMVGNLIDNAVRHNHAGGRIGVFTGIVAGSAFLRVENTGEKIPPDTAARLLEPFVRGDGSRIHTGPGTGLGLSIVDAVVTAHRGTVALTADPRGGLIVEVRLPRAEPLTTYERVADVP